MTPADVAAIRMEYGLDAGDLIYADPEMVQRDVRALVAALEAAWAENGDLNEEIFNMGTTAHWRERAERAEAERDAFVDQVDPDRIHMWRERAEHAERWRDNALDQLSMVLAALARVRALCDLDPVEWALAGADMAGVVRAAIEGEAGQ